MQSDYNKRRKQILVVDDDPEIVESIRLALETFGYDVETAADGSTGLALAEMRRPDLMILDMMTPKRSGFLVLETLRQIDNFPTRIIMITANEGSRHQEYAEALGVDAYIRKPFPMEELLETIDRVLADQ
ncbi:MAG: response regulator transcription factor [Thermoguttaceae bacterium]|jgi:DNA-binding response OmpR family regulator|nr:response regulator transcription factor [Thermoguttaceae bacterium]